MVLAYSEYGEDLKTRSSIESQAERSISMYKHLLLSKVKANSPVKFKEQWP